MVSPRPARAWSRKDTEAGSWTGSCGATGFADAIQKTVATASSVAHESEARLQALPGGSHGFRGLPVVAKPIALVPPGANGKRWSHSSSLLDPSAPACNDPSSAEGARDRVVALAIVRCRAGARSKQSCAAAHTDARYWAIGQARTRRPLSAPAEQSESARVGGSIMKAAVRRGAVGCASRRKRGPREGPQNRWFA